MLDSGPYHSNRNARRRYRKVETFDTLLAWWRGDFIEPNSSKIRQASAALLHDATNVGIEEVRAGSALCTSAFPRTRADRRVL